ncbi:zinc finger, CCHC-type containing protein [Tanacetum coccineum]
MRIALSAKDKLTYLEHHIHAVLGQQLLLYALVAHNRWLKASKEIACLMLVYMTPELKKNLEHFVAYDMLQELKIMFSQQAKQELLQTVRDFHACKQEEGQSISSYVLNMKSYIDNLERLGHPVSLNLATVNELHVMLKLHEQMLPKKDDAHALHAIRASRIQKNNNKNKKPQKTAKGKNQRKGKTKLSYTPNPKIPPLPKKDNPAKGAICHECNKIGHWRRNRPQYLAELKKKKKQA